jgi:uncharacterized protein YacL
VVKEKNYVRANTTAQNNKRPSLREVKLIIRSVFAVIFFILGFNLSKSTFFMELPFFGVHTLLEVLISVAAAFIGFFVLPLLLVKAKYWIENLINKTVSDIVSNFWEQQSKKINEARKEKQKRKSEEQAEKVKINLLNSLVLDTSVLVDGRILEMVKTGFMDKVLIVPQNVIEELQLISDSKDKVKRQRGRRGLDVVKDLKKVAEVLIPEIKTKGKGVDGDLVEYCKTHKIPLMTLDFNLNKVAGVTGIKVLNINDLVNILKTVMLPGEDIKIKIIQQGKEKEQGIGYLSDGTMIVVEKAKEMVGQEVEARVHKVIQSSAGRIIFCNLSSQE